jgi:hypothetical protein
MIGIRGLAGLKDVRIWRMGRIQKENIGQLMNGVKLANYNPSQCSSGSLTWNVICL